MAKTVDNHYIRERTLKSGKTSLLIEIRLDGQTFRQSLKVEEFGGLAACWKVAREIRDRKLVEMHEGRYIQHFPTVGDLYEEKFSIMQVRSTTKKNQDTYWRRGICKFKDVPIDKITSADIQKSVNAYAADHTFEMTNKFLSVWRQIYQCAGMKGLPLPDRTLGVTVNKSMCQKHEHRAKSISKEDFNKFCDALLEYREWCEDGRYRSQCIWYALQLMAHCGLQPAEAYALTRSDFHLSCPVPYISVTKCVGHAFYDPDEPDKKYKAISRIPKTEYRERNIPISEECCDLCHNILEWSKYDNVFADYNGSLFESGAVCTYLRNVSKKCGIRFTQYTLRHNFSTDLFRQNMNPAVIRDLMGHSSSSTAQTLDYAQTTEQDRLEAMKKRKRDWN